MPMGELHQLRLVTVTQLLKSAGATSVLDLGCGSGALLQYLVREPQFMRILGLEQSGAGLVQAKQRLSEYLATEGGCLELVCASYTEGQARFSGFDAAAMVETIEHVPSERLSEVESSIFGVYRPRVVVMTTPNREYNPLFDLAPGEYRDPDHCFEWDRAKFRQWASGIAKRKGYRVTFSGIGDMHPYLGQPTQLAEFVRLT
ncbi:MULTISPECIES: methyltransferase [Halomonadaceae]|uniref:methyltransferase n=1 Tax=Halomonadaceae TaxID=28256 RepID=UPI00159B3A52|nr:MULTISPECIES: methyltransferase [Halomonas]QJQ95817.1 methyltransferase [Halomonas sp. PA5]